MRGSVGLVTFLALILTVNSYGQGTNAVLFGTVTDSTQAMIPGVQVIGQNTRTGVVTTTITNQGLNPDTATINSAPTVIFNSVDSVQEVRVVTSPADAEFGRGSGQVQILTRSGTNEFHGSVFESNRNTALNANTWFNNLRGAP